jgi:hypothetical protein
MNFINIFERFRKEGRRGGSFGNFFFIADFDFEKLI